MRVCHIISAFYRYDTRIFWKQCRSLVDAGYDVTLIVNDEGDSEIKEGVKIISSGLSNTNRFRRIFYSRKIIFQIALTVNADIYQIHDPEFLPMGLRLIKMGKHVFFDSHEDFPRQILEKEWIPRIFRGILSKIADFYFLKNLKKFDAVVTVTPHIADSLLIATSRVHLVTNYPIIEDSYVHFSVQEYIIKPNMLCYAGTVYKSSLQENIISALTDVDNIKYLIVGTILDEYLLKLTNHESWYKVQFINKVNKSELLRIYGEVTIGIVIFDYTPNVGFKKGTLGNNKIFEYMHAGLPIICTDFDLWKEIIEKYNCGICVNPHNIDEIKSAIRYMLDNKEEAYKMGQNGRFAVLNEYNWNSQKGIYLKIFKDTGLS